MRALNHLKNVLPVYHVNEIHSITVCARAERVFESIKEVTAEEVPLLNILFKLRSLPSRIIGKGGGNCFVESEPVLKQAPRNGFILLYETRNREIALGFVGQFWKISGVESPGISTAQEFSTFDHPKFAKAVIDFYIDEHEKDGNCVVSTETRVFVAGASARRKFTAYWLSIYLGSALLRHMILRGNKRRASEMMMRGKFRMSSGKV